jgi:putative transposase
MIREATNKGLAVGSERFKQEIERLSGLRVTERRRGPKPEKVEFLL